MTQDQVMEATRKILAECKGSVWREDQVANILAGYATDEEWNEHTMPAFQKSIQRGFKGPFKYDDYAGHIFDRNNNLVAQVRGWGHLSKVLTASDAEQLQRVVGGAFVALLNGKTNQ